MGAASARPARCHNREMVRPMDHPVEHPIERSVERPFDRPPERSVEHPFDRPPERSVERPFERPMDRPMDGSVERPMDRRDGAAARQPSSAIAAMIGRTRPHPSVHLSAGLCLSPLGSRRRAAAGLPGAGLLVCRLGRSRPRSAAARLSMGALRTRSAPGQCDHRPGRRRRLRRVLRVDLHPPP